MNFEIVMGQQGGQFALSPSTRLVPVCLPCVFVLFGLIFLMRGLVCVVCLARGRAQLQSPGRWLSAVDCR